MTLEELKQVKKDLDNGIIISKATWTKVLETAIETMNLMPGELTRMAFAVGSLDRSDAADKYFDILRSGICK